MAYTRDFVIPNSESRQPNLLAVDPINHVTEQPTLVSNPPAWDRMDSINLESIETSIQCPELDVKIVKLVQHCHHPGASFLDTTFL